MCSYVKKSHVPYVIKKQKNMKLGRPFNQLTFSEYIAFIPMYETFSDWNLLGLYRSILENEKLALEEKQQVRDLAHIFFQKQFDFLQLKDPKTYIAVSALGQELTKADERQLWENVKVNQQKILKEKKIRHRNFGIYGIHDCGYDTCFYNGLMVQQGSPLCENKMMFDSDKKTHRSAVLKSERIKKERKNSKTIIENELHL